MSNPADPEITTLLFDFGGTLAFLDYELLAQEMSTAERQLTALELEIAEYRLRAAIDQLLSSNPSQDSGLFRKAFDVWLTALKLDSGHIERCWSRFNQLHRQSSLWRVVRPGTHEALAAFRKAGFKMGIISNAEGNVASDAQRFGVADYFDVIVDSHVVGVAKPDPRIFQLALDQLGSRPREALFAGDIYSIDMLGARAAGIGGRLIDALGGYSWVEHVKIPSIAALV